MKITTAKKEKSINFRSFFIIALFVLFSIFCALIAVSITWLGVFLFALSLILCFIFGFIYKKRSRYKYITFIVCAIFMCAAFISFLAVESTYSDEIHGEALVYGMVESDTTLEESRYIYLSSAKINGVSIGGKIKLSVKDTQSKLESGTLISVNAYVKNIDLVNGFKVNGTAFRDNVRYNGEVETITSSNIAGKTYPGLMTKLREAVYSKMVAAMGEENGALAYGIITGDKAYISNDVANYFSVAGLRHILAVSGLHLNILCAFLMFALSKMRVNRKINAITCFVAVVFYIFLANFSPSILRAGFMSLVGIYVYLTGSRSDILSSLSFAFCAILAVAPFFLFEIGFILSASSVYGIALFSQPITRFFTKVKLPQPIARAFGTSLSIQIGIFPACIFAFSNFQLYSIAVNVVMIPLLSLIFVAMIVALLFSFLTTLNFPLLVCSYGISFIDYVAKTVSEFPYAKIIIYSTGLIFLCYALYFVMSRFVIKRSRIIIPLMCLAQCIILVLLQNPTAVLKDSIVPVHFSYSNVSVVSVDGGNYIVGDFWSGSAIRNRLTGLKIRSIDGIFVNKLDGNVVRQIKVLCGTFSDFEVYFPLENATDEAVDLLKQNKSIKFSKFSKSEGFDGNFFDESSSEDATRIVLPAGFHATYEDDLFRAYGMEHGDVSVIFIPFGKNYTLFQSISRYSVIRTNHYYPLDTEAVFLVNNSDSAELNVVSWTLFADYAFDFKSGEVYIPKTTIFG